MAEHFVIICMAIMLICCIRQDYKYNKKYKEILWYLDKEINICNSKLHDLERRQGYEKDETKSQIL